MDESTNMDSRSGAAETSQLPEILALFLALRLTVLFLYTPQGLFNAYSDYMYYYRTAQLTGQWYYPFVNMWYEYPPILAYLPQIAFWVAGQLTPMGDLSSFGYRMFAALFGALVVVFDCGVLVLLHRITERLWGEERANWVGWVYATLSLPMFYWTFSHQVVAVFFTLLALYGLVAGFLNGSAVALGFGMAAKLTPVFLLATAWRALWPGRRQIVQYSCMALSVFAAFYLPFLLLGGGRWIVASFNALAKVGSYGTVWALLDGNYGPGTYGPLPGRTQLEQANLLHANPASVPVWIITLAFGVLYGWFFFRRLDFSNRRNLVWFAALTMLTFHLWSRGWSPQWMVMVLPFVLLSFPERKGLAWVLVLSGLTFGELAIEAAFPVRMVIEAFILLRTLAFVTLAILLVRRLWPGKGISEPELGKG